MILLTPVLLLLALSGCFSEVVDDFTQTCPQFFANPGGIRSPPTVFRRARYQQICQVRQGNIHEYATLYDTVNKIPVYSAYKFEGLMHCDRKDSWFIEPQLENRKLPIITMSSDGGVTSLPHQAVNQDYDGSSTRQLEKGHLAPVYHATSQSCSDATFTLTNAAPQDRSFNRGQWKKTENAVAATLVQKCQRNSTYIVTGVVPGNAPPLKNRVNVPGHFWTAYCCLNNNLRVIASSGFLGMNTNIPVQEMSVSNLEGNLSILYQTQFRVFGGNC